MVRHMLKSLILLCSSWGLLWAQGSDGQRYFPHAVGNAWEWRSNIDGSTRIDEITRDSADANGDVFLFFNGESVPLYRLDTLNQVYFLSKRFNSSGQFIGLYPVLFYKLDVQPGDSFLTMNNSNKVKVVSSASVLFGLETELKVFVWYVALDVFPFAWRYLAKDFGFARNVVNEGAASGDEDVTGCIINGVRFGTLAAVHQLYQGPPGAFELYQNYPNPFNPRTTIRFAVASTSFVSITVYDILGREVSMLISDMVSPGMHETTFDGHSLASGVYLCSARAGPYSQSRVMRLLK